MEQTAKALWDTMSIAAQAHRETNDCTVRCLTAVSGLPYDTCHAQLAKQGRKPRKGIHWDREAPKAAKALGLTMRVLDRSEYRAKTMKTAERDPRLQSGRFSVLVRGHVAGMIDGNVVDWSQGRQHRIKAIYEWTGQGTEPTPAPRRADLPKGSATWRSYRKYKKQDNFNLFD